MVLAVIQKQRAGFRHILVLVPGQHDVPVFHAVAHGHAAHVGIRMLVQHRLGQGDGGVSLNWHSWIGVATWFQTGTAGPGRACRLQTPSIAD